jgi:hypothetical protein
VIVFYPSTFFKFISSCITVQVSSWKLVVFCFQRNFSIPST